MFIAPLKNNIQSSLIILSITSFSLWGCSFLFSSTGINMANDEGILPILRFFTNTFSPFIVQLISFLTVVIGALFLNFVTISQEITTKTNYLPAFLYILFAFSSTTKNNLQPLLVANLFILPALYFLISSYRQAVALSAFYKAGFFLGIASFFYTPYIIVFPIAFIAILLFKSFNWREWVVLSFGLITPVYFYITLNYLTTSSNPPAFEFLKNNITNFQKPIISEYYILYNLFTVIVLFLAIFHYFNKGLGNKIKTVKIKYVILWMLLLSIVLMFNKQTSDMVFLPSIIPLSIIIGDYLSEIKKLKIANTLLLLLIGGFLLIYCHALGIM